jgi:hypothetical protein
MEVGSNLLTAEKEITTYRLQRRRIQAIDYTEAQCNLLTIVK